MALALRIWHFALRLERKARTTKDFTFSRIRLQINDIPHFIIDEFLLSFSLQQRRG
jgi:hypothetical protein